MVSDSGPPDAPVLPPSDAERQNPPDARSADAAPVTDAGLSDARACVSYDFETIGEHLVLTYALELAEISGSGYLTWALGAFGRRGFGIDGGESDWIDPGERLSVIWSLPPRATEIAYYPGTEPARFYVTWADAPPSIIEMRSGLGGTYVWPGEAPTSIGIESTGTAPIALRWLSYCP